MEIKDILKPDEYSGLNQFNQEDKDWINGRIRIRRDGAPGVECVVRGINSEGDYFKLTPEEIVRQYYAYKLLSEYGYRKEQISFEEPVLFAGRQ
ncbi:MAG: type I restriction enzyme HsdR N-terminal domain-containing protein [Bacteroidales bacterium]|nr:type I restriction enzyme HsdR N-terminal domain-containing protein [Clostridium sp.]MCM1202966.1 type I restriction enzyme HsdR N-terminal domain-containing protein [Bacteroidales bacterium]